MNHRRLFLSGVCFAATACQLLSNNPGYGVSPAPSPAPIIASSPTAMQPVGIALHSGYGFRGPGYEIYFTDPSSDQARQKSGGVDTVLVTAIDSARLSVDAAIYSLTLKNVSNALLRAYRRGVQVRIVMESDNMDTSLPQRLKESGIPMLGDRREGLMHNKFIVLDRSEVWTGSMNFTDNGVYEDNNNLIRIQSSQVAEDYRQEFNEMFEQDKFGPEVDRSTPYPNVSLGSTQLEIYFSPDDHVQNRLVELVRQAKNSIYFMAYSFTSDPLGSAIREQATAGVTVGGVMDADQMKSNAGTEYDAFRIANLDVRLDGNSGLMHHKVIIIDEQIVVLGSYNFTASAETKNDENLIVIHDPRIAKWFLQEYQRMYDLSQS